jgi:nucleoside-diphosphate-sugar epimerase
MAAYELVSEAGKPVSDACRMVLEVFVGPVGKSWTDTGLRTEAEIREATDALGPRKEFPVLFHDGLQLEISGADAICAFVARAHHGALPAGTSPATLAAEAVVTSTAWSIIRSETGADSQLDALEAIASGSSSLLRPGRGIATASASAAASATTAKDAPDDRSLTPFVVADVLALGAVHAAIGAAPGALATRPHLATLWERATSSRGPLSHFVEGKSGVGAPPKCVCVTGVTGYVAGFVVRDLLRRGYHVRGTVRDLSRQRESGALDHLLRLAGAAAQLSFFEADLLVDGSFDEAVEGCVAVHHCASPFITKHVEDPESALMRPAVAGALNVLRSCCKGGVSRVVLTSSSAAVYIDNAPKDKFYSEDDWSDAEFLKAHHQHYALSKLVAERTAWEFVGKEREHGSGHVPELVTVCPTMIQGPIMVPKVTTSTEELLKLVDGSTSRLPNRTKCMVDVRDVSRAHVLAQERVDASGRYLLIGACIAWREAARILAESFPLPIPAEVEEGPVPYPQALFSQEKAVDGLGLVFTPIERTLRDGVASFIEHGLVRMGDV